MYDAINKAITELSSFAFNNTSFSKYAYDALDEFDDEMRTFIDNERDNDLDDETALNEFEDTVMNAEGVITDYIDDFISKYDEKVYDVIRSIKRVLKDF